MITCKYEFKLRFWRFFHLLVLLIMSSFIGLCGNALECPAAGGCTTLSGDECVVRCRVEQTLQKYFGFSSFKPGQLEAVLPVLHGRDVFVRIATGGGKSVCMFLPVLTISNSAIGIIVSPLIGLMDQQVCYSPIIIRNNKHWWYAG